MENDPNTPANERRCTACGTDFIPDADEIICSAEWGTEIPPTTPAALKAEPPEGFSEGFPPFDDCLAAWLNTPLGRRLADANQIDDADISAHLSAAFEAGWNAMAVTDLRFTPRPAPAEGKTCFNCDAELTAEEAKGDICPWCHREHTRFYGDETSVQFPPRPSDGGQVEPRLLLANELNLDRAKAAHAFVEAEYCAGRWVGDRAMLHAAIMRFCEQEDLSRSGSAGGDVVDGDIASRVVEYFIGPEAAVSLTFAKREVEIATAQLRAEVERLKNALTVLISALEPSVNYTGVQVIWSIEDRQNVRGIIATARAEIDRLRAENEGARGVIEHYGDEGNWSRDEVTGFFDVYAAPIFNGYDKAKDWLSANPCEGG